MSKTKPITSRQKYQNRKQKIRDEMSRKRLTQMLWAKFYSYIYSEGKKATGHEGRQFSGETGQEKFI